MWSIAFVLGLNTNVMASHSGNDTIFGGEGNDIIQAAEGNDIIFGGDGDDLIFENGGNDIIYFAKILILYKKSGIRKPTKLMEFETNKAA